MYILIGLKKGTRFPSVITTRKNIKDFHDSITLQDYSHNYDFLGVIRTTDDGRSTGNVRKVIWHEPNKEGWLELTTQCAP